MTMNCRMCSYPRSRTALACTAALAFLVLAFLAHPLAAQSAPPDQVAQDNTQKKAASSAASTPQAPAEGFKWGAYEGHAEIEFGFRVLDGFGNRDVYKSMVNLNQGAELFRSTLSLRSNYGTGKLFDRLDVSIYSMGPDPDKTFRLSASKSDKYELRFDFRNLNYYNFLPTWANPLLSKGGMTGQHNLDVTYRTTDFELKFRPTSRLRPFVAYTRSSSFGPGMTTTTFPGNEFVLNSTWHDSTDEYRGGIEIALPKLALTLEQGYRFSKNDTGVEDKYDHTGNVNRPFLGETITLDSLQRGYHDRTTMPVTRIAAKFTPFNNLNISGRYIYSIADVTSTLGEVQVGNLLSLENQLFYASALDGSNAEAKKPNHNGAFLVDWSPISRLTILDQFDTRNFHVSGSALLSTTFFNPSPLSGAPPTSTEQKVSQLIDTFLSLDQMHNQVEAEFDLGKGFYARGGYRYTHSEADLNNYQDGSFDPRGAKVTQHTGIGGVVYRPKRWVEAGVDFEGTSSDGALTRIDLLDYQQVKLDWRVDPVKNLSLTGTVGILMNKNNAPDIDLNAHNRNYSFAANYTLSERFNLSMDYSRSNILSNMAILLPQTLQSDRSIYDERVSAWGGSLGVDFYRGIRADGGLRAILNAGDFPLNYYQPFASFTVPLPGRMAFKTLWQDFSYNEKNSDIQDHRTHLFTFSLAYAY